MKKVLLILAIVILAGSVLSSCKTHERCPAYGKTNKNAVESQKQI